MRIGSHAIRHPWQIAGLIAGAVIGVLLIVLASIVPFRSEAARLRVVAALAEHLESEVELKELRWRVLPQLRAEGVGLTIRHKGRTDVPPLISVRSFAVEGNVLALVRRHVSMVVLEGLDIQIPPRDRKDSEGVDAGRDRAADTSKVQKDLPRTFVIDQMITKDARLTMVPRRPDHDPKVWAIHDLRMESVAFGHAMPFTATLTNAIPPGEIASSGTFGPWQADDPGDTPLGGTYTFGHADLSVFKGIGGILSAHGTMRGTLDRIETDGETETPDFALKVTGHKVALRTKYHAIVDGTNGETALQPVEASFLHTGVVARGGVFKTPGRHGRTVKLDVTIDHGRLEDILNLAVKTQQPPMTGALLLKAGLVLGPGEQDILEKLQLHGQFTSKGMRFRDPFVQQKIDELSHRSRGKAPDEERQPVASDLVGTFMVAGGRLTIPGVTFGVPGSAVNLAGTYDLNSETLDFTGTLAMDAKVSETVGGVKSVLLKVVDPLFKKEGGGSAIPIKISGTRNDPSFGLDKGRVFKKK